MEIDLMKVIDAVNLVTHDFGFFLIGYGVGANNAIAGAIGFLLFVGTETIEKRFLKKEKR